MNKFSTKKISNNSNLFRPLHLIVSLIIAALSLGACDVAFVPAGPGTVYEEVTVVDDGFTQTTYVDTYVDSYVGDGFADMYYDPLYADVYGQNFGNNTWQQGFYDYYGVTEYYDPYVDFGYIDSGAFYDWAPNQLSNTYGDIVAEASLCDPYSPVPQCTQTTYLGAECDAPQVYVNEVQLYDAGYGQRLDTLRAQYQTVESFPGQCTDVYDQQIIGSGICVDYGDGIGRCE